MAEVSSISEDRKLLFFIAENNEFLVDGLGLMILNILPDSRTIFALNQKEIEDFLGTYGNSIHSVTAMAFDSHMPGHYIDTTTYIERIRQKYGYQGPIIAISDLTEIQIELLEKNLCDYSCDKASLPETLRIISERALQL